MVTCNERPPKVERGDPKHILNRRVSQAQIPLKHERVRVQSNTKPARTIADTGDRVARLIDKTLEAERQCVVAGWFDPTALYEAAGKYGLYGNRFADGVCGFLHALIVTCHEWGVKPNVDFAEAVADQHGDVDITAREILAMLVTVDYAKDDFDDYAYAVATLAGRRERAAYHWAEHRKLIEDDDAPMTPATRVPGHLRRKGGHRARTTV